MKTKIINPKLIKDVLSKEDFARLQAMVQNHLPNMVFDPHYQRLVCTEQDLPGLSEFSDKLLPLAQEHFGKKEIKTGYTLVGHYFGKGANLKKHRDTGIDNAYNIDLCLYQNEPWDVWVEDKPYTLQENEAVLMNGNHHWHWREEFPNPDTNIVCNVFFFYTDAD